jgi:hypothetical protein
MMIGNIMMLIMIGGQTRAFESEDQDQVAKMNRPARIEGSAVIAVTTVRTGDFAYSLRYTAGTQRHGEDQGQRHHDQRSPIA